MESLYLLIPVSLLIVLAIGGVLAWSVLGGQFDDLDAEARRILDDDDADASLAADERTSSNAPSVRSTHKDRAT